MLIYIFSYVYIFLLTVFCTASMAVKLAMTQHIYVLKFLFLSCFYFLFFFFTCHLVEHEFPLKIIILYSPYIALQVCKIAIHKIIRSSSRFCSWHGFFYQHPINIRYQLTTIKTTIYIFNKIHFIMFMSVYIALSCLYR